MKKFNLIATTMLVVLTILFAPILTQAASTGTVKTQSQLKKLLADKSVSTIKISTTKKTTLTIPSGDYDKTLIINAPNVRLINNGKFSDITIKNLTKYTENTKGNSLNVTDDKLSVSVDKKSSLKSITISNERSYLHLVADGNVGKLTINSAKVVGIHGTHSKPISVVSNNTDTKLNVSSLITFITKDVQNESKSTFDTSKANIEDDKTASETAKMNIDAELSAIKQQAYEQAYNDYLNYFITQYQTSNNSSQTNNQTNNGSASSGTSDTVSDANEPIEPDDTPISEETTSQPEESSEPTTTYQMVFTHWDNADSFTSYTGRSQYVYIADTEDNSSPLESADWQVSVVTNNESITNESLEWTDLSEATCISGVADSTYYENAYKLTFNEGGTYYLRAKCNNEYIYSVPITVNTDNTNYLDTEIDGVVYKAQAQVSKNNATFKLAGCTPEEVKSLANASYVKYFKSSTLHRGLYVKHVRTDLNSHTIYYTFNKCDEYNSSGNLFQTAYYDDNYKLLQVDNFSNGIMTKSKVTTYDEQGRTYSVITSNFDPDGNVTSRSGYYYTYDESGNQTFHSGIPTE